MRLQPDTEHPHGLSDGEFDSLFTVDKPGRVRLPRLSVADPPADVPADEPRNIHVRGYKEEGTTTTPFDMVMLNDLDRFHLVMDVIDRVPGLGSRAAHLRQQMEDERSRAARYTRARGRGRAGRSSGWTWPDVLTADPCASSSSTRGRAASSSGPRRRRRVVARLAEPARAARPDRRRRAAARDRAASASIDAVGHRIVHGGTEFVAPGAPRRARRSPPAGAHRPRAAAPAEVARRARARQRAPCPACRRSRASTPPSTPACPPAAATYALPREWRKRWALRKYGFHGLSHAYASRRAAELSGAAARALRIVTCHLGAGASLAAVRDGRSVDTTMGFTPLDGLVMATRSGERRPGPRPLARGARGDAAGGARRPRSSTAPACSGSPGRPTCGRSSSARRPATSRPRSRSGSTSTGCAPAIAAMAAALGGLDVLVFTGGVGERSAPIRARAAEGLAFLGVAVDARAQRGAGARRGDLRRRGRVADVRGRRPGGPADRPRGARRAGLAGLGLAFEDHEHRELLVRSEAMVGARLDEDGGALLDRDARALDLEDTGPSRTT